MKSRYIRFLLWLRSWIDTQVPRDILMIEVIDDERPVLLASHLELMARAKLGDHYEFTTRVCQQAPVTVKAYLAQGYPT